MVCFWLHVANMREGTNIWLVIIWFVLLLSCFRLRCLTLIWEDWIVSPLTYSLPGIPNMRYASVRILFFLIWAPKFICYVGSWSSWNLVTSYGAALSISISPFTGFEPKSLFKNNQIYRHSNQQVLYFPFVICSKLIKVIMVHIISSVFFSILLLLE